MTLDRDKARERCEAATEGPWHTMRNPKGRHQLCGVHFVWGPVELWPSPGGAVPAADADFIAHARTDLPAALDEIERLRAALREIEQLNLCGSCDGAGYLGDPTDESGGCPKCGGTGYKQIGGGRIARDALAQIEEARLK